MGCRPILFVMQQGEQKPLVMTVVALNRGNGRRVKDVANISGHSFRNSLDQGLQIIPLSYGDDTSQVDCATLAMIAASAPPSHGQRFDSPEQDFSSGE